MQVGVIDTTPRMGPSGKGAMITVNGNKYWCPVELNPGGLVQGMGIIFDTAFGWNDKESGTPILKFTKIEIKAQVTAPQGQESRYATQELPPIFSNVAGHLAASSPDNPGLIHAWFDALRQELAQGMERKTATEATTAVDPYPGIPYPGDGPPDF